VCIALRLLSETVGRDHLRTHFRWDGLYKVDATIILLVFGMKTLKDWLNFFSSLSDEEKDALAILRVLECTNGCIQYAYRGNASYALDIDATRKAMKFSMGCMKVMEIPLKDKTLKFTPETEEALREVRRLYISGVKNGNEEDFGLFFNASRASAKAVGNERLEAARDILSENVEDIPPETFQWGVDYLQRLCEEV